MNSVQVRQLDGIGATLGQRLREAGAGSLHAFAQLAPARVEAICARPVGTGAAMLGSARALLASRLALTCEVQPGKGPTFPVVVRVTRDGSASSAVPPPTFSAASAAADAARWVLLVSDQEGKLQHLRRFDGSQVTAAPRQQLCFTLPLPPGICTVHLVHTTSLGLDSSIEVGPLGSPPPPPPQLAAAAAASQRPVAAKPAAQKPPPKKPAKKAAQQTWAPSVVAPSFAPSPAASSSSMSTPVGASVRNASTPSARIPPRQPPRPVAQPESQGVDVLKAIGEMSDDDGDADLFGEVEQYDDVGEDPDDVAAAIFGEQGDEDVASAVVGARTATFGGGQPPPARPAPPGSTANGAASGGPEQAAAGDGVADSMASLRRFHAPPQRQRPKLNAAQSTASPTLPSTTPTASSAPRGTLPPRPSSAPVAGLGRLNTVSSRRLAAEDPTASSANGSPGMPTCVGSGGGGGGGAGGAGGGGGGGAGTASQPLLLHGKMHAEPAFPTSRLRISQTPPTGELPSRVVVKREHASPPALRPPPSQPHPFQPEAPRQQLPFVQPPPPAVTEQPQCPPHPLRTNGHSASPASSFHMALGAEPRQRQLLRREAPPAAAPAACTPNADLPWEIAPHEVAAALGGAGRAAPRACSSTALTNGSASSLTNTAGRISSSSTATACSVASNAPSLAASMLSSRGRGDSGRLGALPAFSTRAEQPCLSCPPRLRPTPPPAMTTAAAAAAAAATTTALPPPSQRLRAANAPATLTDGASKHLSANVDEWLAAATSTGSRAKKPKEGAAAPKPEPVFAWLGQRAPTTPATPTPPEPAAAAGMTTIHESRATTTTATTTKDGHRLHGYGNGATQGHAMGHAMGLAIGHAMGHAMGHAVGHAPAAAQACSWLRPFECGADGDASTPSPLACTSQAARRKRSLESSSSSPRPHQEQLQQRCVPQLPRSTAQRAMFVGRSQTDAATAAVAAAAAAPLPPDVFFSATSLLKQRQQQAQRSAA